MAPTNKVLYELIKSLEVISQKDLDAAYQEATEFQKDLAEILQSKDLISDDNLGKLIADSFGAHFVKLTSVTIPDEILNILPEIVARRQQIIPFQIKGNTLSLAMQDPTDLARIEFIRKKTGYEVEAYYATKNDIAETLNLYKPNVEETFAQIIEDNLNQVKEGKGEQELPVIKIIDIIVNYAHQNKASDVHIEPMEEKTLVRYRIDGVMHDIVDLPQSLSESIVSRIKVLAKLRTDEHFAAQDGKIEYKMSESSTETELDIRVSVVPVTKGEKVVLRLLSQKSRQFSLDDLGLHKEDLVKLEKGYKRPYGMILSTGPTGSGKTTTMYAVMKILNRRDVNMMTIEDPVEYDVQGVNQIQVNLKTNLTFASGLKSIVRQDPDIVLVGEIRDKETAGIAVNAAMTGHLVLSTLHTNDAATAIPRLLDFEVEPYLVASTVNIIIAQRLLRKLCMRCRYSREVDEKTAKDLEVEAVKYLKKNQKDKKIRVYEGKGCDVCHHSGYMGRVGIYELIEMDDDIRQMVIARKTASEIKAEAIKKGMRTMFADGMEKVMAGITTLAEVMRVTKEN